MVTDKKFFIIICVTTILALMVIVLGAYVRLSNAGLGCPDWPGCYGQLVMPLEKAKAESIEHKFSDRPVEHAKAWKEMIHRYAAATLGLLILCLAVVCWKDRKHKNRPLIITTLLLLLVVFQALLGMWTVTLLLKPLVVLGHLLGGMTILCLLFWLLLRQIGHAEIKTVNPSFRRWLFVALAVVILQISLGGWTSSNYAALACPDFPTCQGTWWPGMDFKEGFRLWRGLGIDYEGGVLTGKARTAIHMSHRLGAVLVLLIVGTVAVLAMRNQNRTVSHTGKILFALLCVQLGLGVTNVLHFLPLPVAVAHNATAALLLLSLLTLVHYAVPMNSNNGEPRG